MEITSVVFGKIEVEAEAVLQIRDGLYGLETLHEFVLLQQDPSLPFAHLQAKEEAGICLLLTDPFVFYPSYDFELSPADTLALGNPDPHDLQVWVTVTTHEKMESSTINLLAPLVINVPKRIARQIVLHDSGYQTRTPMFAAKEGE